MITEEQFIKLLERLIDTKIDLALNANRNREQMALAMIQVHEAKLDFINAMKEH